MAEPPHVLHRRSRLPRRPPLARRSLVVLGHARPPGRRRSATTARPRPSRGGSRPTIGPRAGCPTARLLIVSMTDRRLLRLDGDELVEVADLTESRPVPLQRHGRRPQRPCLHRQLRFRPRRAAKSRPAPRSCASSPTVMHGSSSSRCSSRTGWSSPPTTARSSWPSRSASGSRPTTSNPTARSPTRGSGPTSARTCPTASASTPKARSGSPTPRTGA